MASNYDNSAWFYDSLSRLVYGNALVEAQTYLLPFIPKNSTILIAGGGTGWILQEITRLHPSGLIITYVEISANMMALSRKRYTGDNEVTFINQPVEDVTLSYPFDIIITPFLFDNFKEDTLQKVFGHLHNRLKTDGLWLNTDFQLTGKWWQNVLLRSMFVFFKLVCNIETSALPDIEKQFSQFGYQEVSEKNFYTDFIGSKVYKKI